MWKNVQDTHPDIFWTPRNGGHWVATRYDDMVQLTTDPGRFSSLEPFVPKEIIPHTGPSQLDASEHGPFRKLVSQAFTPALLKKAEIRARATAVEIIERLRPQGTCDFQLDFAGIMPVISSSIFSACPKRMRPTCSTSPSGTCPARTRWSRRRPKRTTTLPT
ncbi:hypothetical protein [Sphingopyxis flava]|uniref:hypothetical protein n=1 Tax=Sphingopyxis flava TaxID=1507287 RepID=UPI00158FD3DF|nr:hypothetical protein [Sphingopyxis flava]